jgi:signal transduction histidine kinase
VKRPEIATALLGDATSGTRMSNTLGAELAYVAVPVYSGVDVVGVLRITFPQSVLDADVNLRLRGVLMSALVSVIMAILVAVIFARGVARPLLKLREATDELAKGNLSSYAEEGGPKETKQLARSFNTMALRLGGLIERQRAFAGDASHQLRTPLTALQLRLERATEMLETDPAGAAERIEAAMVEADRLQRLVEGLLVLSRSENADKIIRDICDASQIAHERFENWEALAGEQDITLILDVPESAMIYAIPGALEQVIDNYIDNALGIVPANSTITVKISVESELTKISVIDEGPGIPEADIAKAFNRFWRARSDTHGSGLGLAIVDRLATASGGRAELVNLSPKGLSADAYFPTA